MFDHLDKKTSLLKTFKGIGLCVIVLVASMGSTSSGYTKVTSFIEICDNAIDDDGDGLIDLNDSDCECVLVEVESLIPNPSFEETSCCPEMQSELNCASGWIQASYPTTDFIHTCGWSGWDNDIDQFPPPQPFPEGGEGIVGLRDGVYFPANSNPEGTELIDPNWKEYAGACLLSPMKADSIYRIQFDLGFVDPIISPPINFTLFGTTDCANLPFGAGEGEPSTGCPTNAPGWVELGSVPVQGGSNIWIDAAIDVFPNEDIVAIALGPSCVNNLRENNRYYFLDNLQLDKTESFQIDISTASNPCAADFTLEVADYPDLSYQWYKDGVALVGEINPQLSQMYGEGDYRVRTINGAECMLSGIHPFNIPVIRTAINQSICEGETFSFGDQNLTESGLYIETLSSSNNCDSVVVLNLEIENVQVDSMTVKIFEGETFEIEGYSFTQDGNYSIELTSPNGCKTETFLQVAYHDIFIPNAFSPNFDGLNDKFTALAEQGLIQQVDMNIYNRWGSLIFQGPEWDGRHNGKYVDSGVYIYVMKIILSDDSSQLFSGSISVLF